MDYDEMIRHLFDYLSETDYGYSPSRQEVEAYFWDRFFEYFKSLQKTEQLRILNQLSDLVEDGISN